MSTTPQAVTDCWLFHRWSMWSNPMPGEITFLGGKYHDTCQVQERVCTKCNKRELRMAT